MRGVWLVAMMAGCATEPKAGIQIGGEGDVTDTCGAAVETVVPPSEVVLDGHSGDEAMALLAGPTVFAPTWFDGRTEALTLTGALVGDTVTVVDYPDGAAGCARRIELDVAYTLVSADGTLSEAWEHRLHWQPSWDSVDLPLQLPVSELGGSLDWASLAPDAVELIASIRLGGDGDAGRIELVSPNLPGTGAVESEAQRTSVCSWDERPRRGESESADTGS